MCAIMDTTVAEVLAERLDRVKYHATWREDYKTARVIRYDLYYCLV